MVSVLKENVDSVKISASRTVLLTVLALGTIAFAYVMWRIGYKGDTFAMYGDLISEWKSFLVWVGIVPYSVNKGAQAIGRNAPVT